MQEYDRLRINLTLGKGELEAIAYCKIEKCLFATNDRKAQELAKNEGISIVSLQAILKTLWKKNLKSKEEVRKMLKKIKTADNLYISKDTEEEIFNE